MINRCLVRFVVAGCAAAAASVADADFHKMQIEQVIGGADGDTTAQAIQLRLRFDGECVVSEARLIVSDAAGANPVLLVDLQSDVPGCNVGDRILITSANFAGYTAQPLAGDFTMTNLIPESYLAAGSLTFEDDVGTVFWRLSWGGASYTGPTSGVGTNDDDGNFGPPIDGPLPSSDDRALRFQGPVGAASTTNLNDYALTGGAMVCTNNAGESEPVVICPSDVNDDGAVNVLDLIDVLLCFGQSAAPPCDDSDISQDGVVNVLDLIDVLLAFGTTCP